MRLSFYLDKPDAERSIIMLNVSFRGQRLRFGTGVSMEPAHWNPKRQEPKASGPTVNSDRHRLEGIAKFVRATFDGMKFGDKQRSITPEDIAAFRSNVGEFLTPLSKKVVSAKGGEFKTDFDQFIATYTIRSKTGMVTTRRPIDATIQLYQRTLDYLVDWSLFAKRPLAYDTIDEAFYASYCEWLGRGGMTDSSAGNYIKTLKTFMKWSRQKGFHTTSAYETFYRDSRTGDTIALTVEELRRVRDLDLTKAPRLERSRDLFLLQCYTGMRYGDLSRLEPRHFDDTAKLIRYTTQKNDTPCIVPITKPLAVLLERYPSRLFEFPSDVKQNVYIKEVAARADMKQSVSVSQWVNGKRVEGVFRRDELVTTHVARRTFVTTSLRFGVPEAVISAVTGHAAKGMLQQHYVKFDEDGIRDIITRAWEQL